MIKPGSKSITRRRFLTAMAAGGGLGAASWSLARGTSLPVSTSAPAGAMTTLPPVTTAEALQVGADATVAGPAVAEPARTIDALCRDAWGAQPIVGELVPHTPVRMTVHHTGTVLTSNADAPAHLRDHQAFHQLDRHWPDLAYHYIIDATGVIYEGRRATAVGDTGTSYDPTGHLLVACEGNFEQQEVAEAQLDALADLLAWASGAYAIDPATITAHRDWAPTACPGTALYAPVADGTLETAVRSRIEAGGIGLELRCGVGAEAVVAAIEAGSTDPVSPVSWDDRGVE